MFRSSLSLAIVLVFTGHMFVIGGASVAVKNFPDEPRGEPRRQKYQNVSSTTLNLDLSKRRYVPDPLPTLIPVTNTFDPDVGLCVHGPTKRSLPSQKYGPAALKVLHAFKNMPFVRRTTQDFYDQNTGYDLPLCAGVFVTHYWVLTAAHCLRVNTTYTVRGYGVYNNMTPYYQRHPRWADKTVNNDVGIVYTERPNNYMRPICVPTFDTDPRNNTICIATGWSHTHKYQGRTVFGPHFEWVKIIAMNSEEFIAIYSHNLSRPIKLLDGILWCTSEEDVRLRAVGILTYRDKDQPFIVFARISRLAGWIKRRLRGPLIKYIGKDYKWP